MNQNERTQVILELLSGKATAAALATRHGLEETEVLAWRDTWLAGAAAANQPRAPSHRWWVVGAVIGAAALGLVSKVAIAATCAAPASFSNLGLYYFCPNDPALASEVNSNTAQLVSLMQQKIGGGFGAADAGASTSGITTSTATVNGSTTLTGGASVGSAGSVNFGNTTRQMLNLWGSTYGVGVQTNTLYLRSGGNFAWYVNGTHSNTELDPGAGGVEAMRLTANGALSVRGLKQVDRGGLTVSPYEIQRYTVDATPASVGSVVPIDYNTMTQMCRDDDGCQFTLSMINWDGTGNFSTRAGVLYMSATSNVWRFDTANGDLSGTDSNGASTEIQTNDCYFGDNETATDSNNGRSDFGGGFGLLNCKGCNYSDATTTCRVTFRD